MKSNRESMVVVAKCGELFEAEVLVAKLQSNGIEACIKNNNAIGCLQSPYAAVDECCVLVMDVDEAAAKEIICNC